MSDTPEPRTWTIHVCKDCKGLAHSGDHCPNDKRRVWTEMERVEVIEKAAYDAAVERAERAESEVRAYGLGLPLTAELEAIEGKRDAAVDALDEAIRIVEGLITEEVRALPDDQLSDCEAAAVAFLAAREKP